jgi:glycosyltransferase involved in cell wall biosynthesis
MSAVRVLHILPSIRGYGAERLTVELLRHLPSSDVDAALLTIYEPPAAESAKLPFPIFHAGRKSRKDRLFFLNLVREIRRYKPDIVHTHTHVGKYWGRVAALLAGVRRIVHTEHNPCDARRTPAERTADWLLEHATSRVVTFFRDQGVRLSELEPLPQNKLVVIPNGLVFADQVEDRRSARKRLGVTDDEFAIMLIGRMEYQKNHILALRAFSMLSRRSQPRALLFFAGAGENEVMLRGLASALKVDDRVRFMGYRTDVPSLLPGADLVLMTSWFEGMPLALLEAMIAGVPIVTTPWLGAANMLENGRYGFLSAGFEPQHVAAEIERAIARPSIRRNVAERARQYVRRQYHMDRMVDAYRHMYLQLCEAS